MNAREAGGIPPMSAPLGGISCSAMVTSILSGGLGNQMFQYARGRALALRKGVPLALDISRYVRGSSHREFLLGHFDIKARIRRHSLHQLLRWVDRFRRTKHWVQEPGYNFEPTLLTPTVNRLYLSGVWQSEKYFMDYADVIRQDLTLRQPLSSAAAKVHSQIGDTAVSLHVRRGDYVTHAGRNRKYGFCPPAYYVRAMTLLAGQVSNPTVFIFSDDVEWARSNVPISFRHVFVSAFAIADYEEMALMSSCRHHIIANSTFSWWGAWLNPRTSRIVIAPKVWMASRPDTPDIIPPSWVRI